MRARTSALVALLLLLPAAATACFRAVKPAEKITAPPPPGEFPHVAFDAVLEEYVDDEGLVDYKGIQQDRAALDRYTSTIAAFSPESHPELFPDADHALAYYINTYNALAITGVIDRPGLESVETMLVGFFYLTKYRVGGKKLSLYTLENGVIRKQFDEPRIHFALNCDSASCPRLPAEAWWPDRLEEQLHAATQEFVHDDRNVRVADDGAIELSQIFEWYAEDFEAGGGAVAFVEAQGRDLPDGAEVRYIPYDWSLIAQPGRGP